MERTTSPALLEGSVQRRMDSKAPSCTVFRHGKAGASPEGFAQISEILQEDGALVWFDMVDPSPDDLAVLQEEFDLHPLAIEDAVHAHERSKIESYDTYWFVILEATTVADAGIEFHEMAIFAGVNFVVTVRHAPAYPLEEVRRRWQTHPSELQRSAGFLLYTILDTVVDGYIPVAETFQVRVDQLEENLFTRQPKHDRVLTDIFEMKKEAQHFRRAVLPMRDILNPIIRQDIRLYPEQDNAYFRDIYDHAIRVIEHLDTLRDLMTSALEIHLSVLGNRQNEVAKQLTVIATIFLPLTFVTGFFGQNFGLLVGTFLPSPWVFWVFGIGLELATLFVTLGYFKRKGWF